MERGVIRKDREMTCKDDDSVFGFECIMSKLTLSENSEFFYYLFIVYIQISMYNRYKIDLLRMGMKYKRGALWRIPFDS